MLRYDKSGSAGTAQWCNTGLALGDWAQTASPTHDIRRFPHLSLHSQSRGISYVSYPLLPQARRNPPRAQRKERRNAIRMVYHLCIADQLRVYCGQVNFATEVQTLKSQQCPLQSVANTPYRFDLTSSASCGTQLFPDLRHMSIHGTPLKTGVFSPHPFQQLLPATQFSWL